MERNKRGMRGSHRRITAMALAVLMVLTAVDFSGVMVVSAEEGQTKTITGFAALANDVKQQKVEIGTSEGDLNLPDTLTAEKSETEEIILDGITWVIDANNSVSDTFDSSEEMNGAFYYYTPVLPEKDADGNIVTLADNVSLPEITVLVGTSDIMTREETDMPDDNSVASVTIGTEIERYPTIEAAVTAAIGEGVTATITLLADITPAAAINIPTGSNITLDLHGFTIDRKLTVSTSNGSVIINNGKLTITDSTVTAETPNATPRLHHRRL